QPRPALSGREIRQRLRAAPLLEIGGDTPRGPRRSRSTALLGQALPRSTRHTCLRDSGAGDRIATGRVEMTQEAFREISVDPPVRGSLHRPATALSDGLVFTHGAGGNSNASLLVALAEAFAEAGLTVLRCDLPFRQARALGSPRPGDAARDRQ